jgi:oligo-1,6-glucosidase
MRRAASTSRTSGRFAVGPAGRSWTPTPIPARHEEAEEPTRKINNKNYELTGPAPSGMTDLRHTQRVVTDGDFALLLTEHPTVWAFLRRGAEPELLMAVARIPVPTLRSSLTSN